MASYRLTDAALADLDQLYEYGIFTFGLSQANQYYDGLVAKFQAIADSPLIHPGIEEIRTGYRRALYCVHSIYYRTENRDITIVRILGRQDTQLALESINTKNSNGVFGRNMYLRNPYSPP